MATLDIRTLSEMERKKIEHLSNKVIDILEQERAPYSIAMAALARILIQLTGDYTSKHKDQSLLMRSCIVDLWARLDEAISNGSIT